MEKFEVHILGCGSALPTTRHFASSQVINFREKLFMIDCGVNAQVQLRRTKLKFTRLSRIFISHLHGDHCLGLPGLLSTLGLMGRTSELVIHSPGGLEQALTPLLKTFCGDLPYKLTFQPFGTMSSELIYDDRSVQVFTIPLQHRIPTAGFLFREKPLPNHILRSACDFYQVPIQWMCRIKAGFDYEAPDGTIVPNAKLSEPSIPPRSYAYCSDTLYTESIVSHLKNVDLLYHEATFAQAEQKQAVARFHSTASEAAKIARLAEVKRLLLGHYSARYTDEKLLLEEAKSVFLNTELTKEGMVFQV